MPAKESPLFESEVQALIGEVLPDRQLAADLDRLAELQDYPPSMFEELRRTRIRRLAEIMVAGSENPSEAQV